MFTIENHIDIQAPTAKILAALTTKDGVAAWWTDDCDVSPTEATYRFAKPQDDKTVTFRVDELTDAGVAMTCIRETNNADWLGTRLSFALSKTATGTRVALVHAGYPANNECYERCTQGWSHFLGSLKKLAETGTGEPYTRPETHSIIQHLEIAGDAERIFAAVTTAKGVAAWWTRECEISPTEHVYAFTKTTTVSSRFRVDRAEPGKVVLRCVEDRGMGWLGSTLAYTIVPDGRSTKFTLEHTGIRDKSCAEVCTRGWTFFMASLKNFIERGQGTPHPTENTP